MALEDVYGDPKIPQRVETPRKKVWLPREAHIADADELKAFIAADPKIKLHDIGRQIGGVVDVLESLYQIQCEDPALSAAILNSLQYKGQSTNAFNNYKVMRDALEDLRNEKKGADYTVADLAAKLGKNPGTLYSNLTPLDAIKVFEFSGLGFSQ